MKKTILILSLLLAAMLSGLSAQEARPISVKVIAPAFGVNPLFIYALP